MPAGDNGTLVMFGRLMMALPPFCGHYGARDRLVFIQWGSDEPQGPHECRKKAF